MINCSEMIAHLTDKDAKAASDIDCTKKRLGKIRGE